MNDLQKKEFMIKLFQQANIRTGILLRAHQQSMKEKNSQTSSNESELGLSTVSEVNEVLDKCTVKTD